MASGAERNPIQRARIVGVVAALGSALLAACSAPPVAQPAPKPAAPAAPVRPGPAPVAPQPVVAPPAAAKPAWTARKVVADAVEVPASTVVVTRGDTLWKIALRAGVSAGAIAAENNIAPPFTVRVGQTLRVPAGRYHSIKPGETGIAIARAYGVKWSDVVTANQLEPPYTLAAGQRLRLPSRAAIAAMTLEERARAFQLDIDDLITGSEPATRSTAAKNTAKPAPRAAAATPKVAPRPEPSTAIAAPQFVWPLEGRILSGFGPKPGGRYNDGVNIKAAAGAAVRAAADGVVAYADDGLEGFGGLVLIKHAGGWVTAYAHNEALLVARGKSVKRGDIIARAGSTGSVNEPQLHFEIRRGRTPVDPLKHLRPSTRT